MLSKVQWEQDVLRIYTVWWVWVVGRQGMWQVRGQESMMGMHTYQVKGTASNGSIGRGCGM